jgi:2-C-methyl-D-erythritol 2,4-cyclodiphosphate synthase
MDSREIVTKAVALLREAGYGPVNIDATVIAEVPKLLPHAPAMRRAIAGMTGLDAGDVSLKATTNEQMGFVGRREGIAAIAVATVAPLTALTDG